MSCFCLHFSPLILSPIDGLLNLFFARTCPRFSTHNYFWTTKNTGEKEFPQSATLSVGFYSQLLKTFWKVEFQDGHQTSHSLLYKPCIIPSS
jgi:hypothetical protein